MPLRIVVDGFRDPLFNMALDEALLLLRRDSEVDTLRLYMWRPSGVSLGRSQDPYSTLNLECVFEKGFIPVQRPTGGGALLHMEGGEITYSIVLGAGHKALEMDVKESAEYVASPLIDALKLLGVEPGISGEYQASDTPLCYFRRGTSDILVNGKKISGSAQRRVGDALLQHGTLLLKVDPSLWSCVIRDVDPKVFTEKVASLQDLGLNRRVGEVLDALVAAFSNWYDGEVFKSSLEPYEVEYASQLLRDKYLPWLQRIKKRQ